MVSNKPASSVLRLVGVCCAVSMLSACEPTMEEVVARHRSAVEENFGRIGALDAVVRNTPPAENRIETGTARVVLRGEDRNALFIRAENLTAPGSADPGDIGATHSHTIEACGEALNGTASGRPKAFDSYLGECASAEYIFVLRTSEEVSAEIVDERTFRPGRYEGDVLLFRLADGALLGGFGVSGENSATITVQGEASAYGPKVGHDLESDLSSKVFADINRKLRQYVPGAIPEA